MSMMQDMMADMLKKALPPEVMELMTPEKIKQLGADLTLFIENIKSDLDCIKKQNVEILERLEQCKPKPK